MARIPATNQNAAYDLNVYAPKPKTSQAAEIRSLPGGGAARRARIYIGVIAMILVVGALAGMRIMNEIRLNELTSQITAAANMLSQMQSEETRLEMELESVFAVSNMEESDLDRLGLAPISKDQIEYISVYDKEGVVYCRNGASEDTLFDKIEGIFDTAVEYLAKK